MSKQAVVSMIVGVIFGAAGVWELTARAQMQAPGYRPFGSKIVVILTKTGGAELENPEIRAIGNRSFVVGQYVKESKYFRENIPDSPLWLPIDEVVQINEMRTPAEKKNAREVKEEKTTKEETRKEEKFEKK
jgi:hypothetical protein